MELTQHPLALINASWVPFAFCAHGGWYECAMQTHALCTKNFSSDPLVMKKYIACNFDNLDKTYVTEAENHRLCAANVSVPYDKLWKCATGYSSDSGQRQLDNSSLLAVKLNVDAAPTAFVNGKEMPGVPNATTLLKHVCDAYTGEKPKGCSSVDAVRSVAPEPVIKKCKVR